MMTYVLQDGWSPLYAASCNGHLDVVKTLLEAGANINQVNKVGGHVCIQYHCKHIRYMYLYDSLLMYLIFVNLQ